MRGAKRNIPYVLSSMIIPFLFLLLCWTICGINFETNDDTGILMFVTGAKTGTPTAETVFCNILWGALVSSLYRLNESIPWYTCIYLFLIWIVLSLMFRNCLKIFDSHNDKYNILKKIDIIHFVESVMVFSIIYFSIFSYYTALLQFTTIAAICGMGAILLVLAFPEGGGISYLLFSLLLFFSFTIRPKTGYMTSAAIIILFLELYIIKNNINKVFLIITAGMQMFTYIVNFVYEQLYGWTAFRQFHRARWLWKDYPHLSFADNPTLYESVGWSEKLYNLVNSWFFMDRRVNTRTFSLLNSSMDFKSRLLITPLKSFFATSQLKMTFFIIGIVIIGLIITFIKNKKYKHLMVLMISFAVTLLALGFFSFTGRLPYRVSFSIIILFFFPTIILLFQNNKSWNDNKFFLYILCFAFLSLIWYSYFGTNGLVKITDRTAHDNERVQAIQTKCNIEIYAIENIENIYVYDNSLALAGSPFTSYSQGKPYNLTFWGGSGMYSPPYYKQLKRNGLEELYPDQFFNSNIFFMSAEEPNSCLLDYLKEEFSGSIQTEIVYNGEGFIVYRFLR